MDGDGTAFGGVAASVLVHAQMSSPHIALSGTPSQKASYLPAIVKGEKVCAIAVTEPGGGTSRVCAARPPVIAPAGSSTDPNCS